jgi:hypothetical protein
VIYLEDGRIRSRLNLIRSRSRVDARHDGKKGAPPRSAAEGGEKRAKAVLAWLQKLGA